MSAPDVGWYSVRVSIPFPTPKHVAQVRDPRRYWRQKFERSVASPASSLNHRRLTLTVTPRRLVVSGTVAVESYWGGHDGRVPPTPDRALRQAHEALGFLLRVNGANEVTDGPRWHPTGPVTASVRSVPGESGVTPT